MMKPRRVVMTFGTNDTGMEVSDFIAHYTALIQAIQQSYPYTDIIVNTVPPVPADHSNYPHMDPGPRSTTSTWPFWICASS